MTKRRFCLQVIFLIAACGAIPAVALAQGAVNCVRGKPNAPVRMEVYLDYECPGCRAFYLLTMKSVFTDYADKGKVCVAYRDFPSYPHSREAARFARAALRVGLPQWQKVTEALFQSQPQWSQSGKVELVVAAALAAKEMALVRKYFADPSLEDAIDRDALLGLKLQVTTTPTSFITGQGKTERAVGALTYAAIQRRLDALLGGTQTAALRPPTALPH